MLRKGNQGRTKSLEGTLEVRKASQSNDLMANVGAIIRRGAHGQWGFFGRARSMFDKLAKMESSRSGWGDRLRGSS